MIILNGKSLGERQQKLNKKVNDAAKEQINFNALKNELEKSDVDMFFKIDLAAKYKDLDYILDILKSGDRLYISRALNKSNWLYNNNMKDIINPENLSTNVFPSMSIKMRNLMLTAIASNLKDDETRAIDFYTFCLKIKLHNIALKFLLLTPESFKRDIICNNTKIIGLIRDKEGKYLEHFIGDSFELAEVYINNINCNLQKGMAIYLLRYMYALSDEKYLNMLEICESSILKVLGRRISKHIIHNHKSRVMKKTVLYASVLNKEVLSRNIKIDEAKIFAIDLLPDRSANFFYNYYRDNKIILDLIPAEEKFSFIKKIFHNKYDANIEFEFSKDFYSNNFFELMTTRERENWALEHIKSCEEILGSGKDYLWHKFVNFDLAFKELQKQIMKTTDQNKRCEILKVLLESAKTEEELTKLLNYFSHRHRNEARHIISNWLDEVISRHKVWHFGEDCWRALEKILFIANVYSLDEDQYQREYIVHVFMYHVFNKKPLSELLYNFLDKNIQMSFCYTMKGLYLQDKSETDILYKYILEYYSEKIKTLNYAQPSESEKKNIHGYLRSSLNLVKICDKTSDDLPEVMLAYIKLNWEDFKHEYILTSKKIISSTDIVHYLKKDATLVVDNFPQIKKYCEYTGGNLNWLVHKLKVYFSFPNDISEQYLKLFNECLSAETLHYRSSEISVRGIFVLADCTRKIEFLDKYIPNEKKIDRSKTSSNIIDIQKYICRQMHCSRPPLPISKVFQYITGDYVQYCLVLFHMLSLNLPSHRSLEFVQKLIDSPVSIQKHGLRLAFECFDTEKLQLVILEAWKRTKNVSLRMILYKKLCSKISNDNDDTQLQLFDILVKLTLDLNDDDQEILQSLHQKVILPDHLSGRYLEAAWLTVSKFSSEKLGNIAIMTKMIDKIEQKIHLVPESCVDKIVNEHVHFMLDQKQLLNKSNNKQDYNNLLSSKWDLTKSSIVFMRHEEKVKDNIVFAKHIIKQCIDMWNEVDKANNKFVIREFLQRFISGLDKKCYIRNENGYSDFVTLMQTLEIDLKKSLPAMEIYKLSWILQTSLVSKKVFLDSNMDIEAAKIEDMIKSAIVFGNHFGNLIKTRVEEGTCFRFFYEQIKEIAEISLQNILEHFRKYPFNSNELEILFCSGLVEHESLETYLLALMYLPLQYEGKYTSYYVKAINKIKESKNKELQLYMYEKFVNTDFIKR